METGSKNPRTTNQTKPTNNNNKNHKQEMNVKLFLVNLFTLIFCNSVDIVANVSESIFY